MVIRLYKPICFLLLSVVVLTCAPGSREYVCSGGWGSRGSGEGQFESVVDLAVGRDGDVYVIDDCGHRLHRFTATGSFLSNRFFPEPPEGRFGTWVFGWPTAVATAPDGSIYVADNANRRVERIRFTGSGAALRQKDIIAFNENYLVEDIAVAHDGDIYAADMFSPFIDRYSPSGSHFGRWGPVVTGGLSGAEYENSLSLAVAPDGKVYVVDVIGNHLTYFSPNGSPLGTWGRKGSGEGEFESPHAVSIAPDGTVFVADTGNHRIQYFTGVGSFLGSFGAFGAGKERSESPSSLAVAPDGTVYVGDDHTCRIQYFKVSPVTYR
jgi:tripartite motif-containing protein 71